MTDVTEPIVVDPNPVPSQVYTGLRDFGLVATAVPTLLALLGKHDVLGLINWLESDAAKPALGVLVTAGIFVWRQWNARHAKAVKVTLAAAAPDSVAVVKGAPIEPPPISEPPPPAAPLPLSVAAAGRAGSAGSPA